VVPIRGGARLEVVAQVPADNVNTGAAGTVAVPGARARRPGSISRIVIDVARRR